MIKQILEISSAARLCVQRRQLIFVRDEEEASVPIEDLSVLVLSNSVITHTQ